MNSFQGSKTGLSRYLSRLLMTLAVLSLLPPPVVCAQRSDTAAADSISAAIADSINAAAADPEFITASLLFVEPGDKVYTTYGHAAIRMQSPSNNLDVTFSFEMILDFWLEVKFMFSTVKAGFICDQTDAFLKQYPPEERGVTEYILNLNPRQKQELWRRLDQEVMRGQHWDYNVMTTNCSAMCVYMIESSLLGEHIEYHDLPDYLQGDYADVLKYMSRYSPWSNLFWLWRIGSGAQEKGILGNKLAPELLCDEWQKAEFVDSAGQARPVFAGEGKVLLPWKGRTDIVWFTPTKALIAGLLLLIAIAACLIHRKRTRHKHKPQNK